MKKNSHRYSHNPGRKKTTTIIKGGLLIALVIIIFLGVWQIDQVREFFGQASYTPANIKINTQAVIGPLNRSWQNLAQGGEGHDWRLAPIQSKVQALNPQYIRIDHIYDFYDIVQGSPGNITFNFAKFDPILTDILNTGATPYIALSYMPPAISKGDIVDQPHYWSDWQNTIRATIEHVSGTRGIDNVYYEVWNEPDLFGGWKYYGSKSYLTMYSYAALGARQAQQNSTVKPFKLGGPATTALYQNWFDALAKHAIQNNLKYDFFSWHKYTHDIDQYRKDQEKVVSWLQRYPQLTPTLELHVTEWGADSENHPAYDNYYGAAHTVAGAITLNQWVDRAFVFEIQDGKGPNNQSHWGRWGLLTHQDFNSQPKPRYHALKLLDSLGTQRLQVTGQGSWVKAIATRNMAGNPEFVMANASQNNNRSENVPVTFQEIEPGSYQLSLQFLDGKQSSQSIATSAAVLRTYVPMNPNAVVYGELKKLIN